VPRVLDLMIEPWQREWAGNELKLTWIGPKPITAAMQLRFGKSEPATHLVTPAGPRREKGGPVAPGHTVDKKHYYDKFESLIDTIAVVPVDEQKTTVSLQLWLQSDDCDAFVTFIALDDKRWVNIDVTKKTWTALPVSFGINEGNQVTHGRPDISVFLVVFPIVFQRDEGWLGWFFPPQQSEEISIAVFHHFEDNCGEIPTHVLKMYNRPAKRGDWRTRIVEIKLGSFTNPKWTKTVPCGNGYGVRVFPMASKKNNFWKWKS